jgi:DNA polymerase-3 subunit delta'
MSGCDSDSMPWLAAPLAAACAHQQGHALLVHGPAGVGQFEFALRLAKAWMCEAPLAERPGAAACGRCDACHLFDAHAHPDLRVLLPETLQEELGWSSAEADSDDGGDGGRRRQPSKDIRVEQVRSMVQFSTLTRARGRHKVVVAYPAERMNAVSANTLLKTLEEPPPAQRFVLATQAPQRLMATVRSRCQAVRLPAPAREEALAWLGAQGVPAPEVLLDGTGGSPLEALAWSQSGVDAKTWAQLPDAVRRGDAAVLAGWPVPRVVDALQRICHDALALAVGAAPRYFPAMHGPGNRALDSLLAWAAELRRVARHAEHPWHAPLLIEALVTQGRQALR